MDPYSKAQSIGPERGWFKRNFIDTKLNSVAGIALLVLLSLMVGLVNASINYWASLGLVFLFFAILLIILFIRFPYFGLYFIISFSVLIHFFNRLFFDTALRDIQFNDFLTYMEFLLLISVMNKPDLQISRKSYFWKNPIAYAFLLMLAYYIICAVDPGINLMGWVSFFLKYIQTLICFYCFYCLLNSWKKIKFFIFFTIAINTLLAVYSCKQQWFGLADFEEKWLLSDPKYFNIYFQGGLLRKWSLISDPAAAGILFASVAMLCLVLIIRLPEKKYKVWLGVAFVFNILGYTFSGTRTATLMIVAGIFFYGLATFYEKATRWMIFLFLSALAILMVSPYSPPSVTRLKSAFYGHNDASAAIREYDRHQIQPYLYKHPLGGGVFTTGYSGAKYNPNHYLSNFQPDSGYMLVFAEQGWIGLLVQIIVFFILINTGIQQFYKTSNPEYKTYCAAIITMLFCLMAGQYSQFALNYFPFHILGYLVLIIRLPVLDKALTLKTI